ncbi:MAG: hypothetical protein J6Y37_16845 [Paludibacteraceae bacterium]|nr:hypothetical protein [Paludibacteraceae bacterium]
MMGNMTAQDVRDYYENLDLAGIAYSDLDFKIKYADFAMEFLIVLMIFNLFCNGIFEFE